VGLEPAVLGRIGGGLALVSLRARVGRCTAVKLPLVVPVPIIVTAITAAGTDRLAVLPPEPIRGLRIYVTLRIQLVSTVSEYTCCWR
jgi:hypothetical protein